MNLVRRTTAIIPALVAVVMVSWTAGADGQASNSPKEQFVATAVNISNVGKTGVSQLDLTITRWTTDAERDRLVAIFKEKGPDVLLRELQKLPKVGSISAPGSLAYDLRYARQMPGADGGRHIILATDRPIAFWEVTSGSRTLQYPFTLIELQLDQKNEGVGKLSLATKITLKENTLVLENFADQPVMLNNVHKAR